MTCSEAVMTEFGDPEKMMLMYRFSMEVEKARNSLDLNLGVMPEMDDHIVPNADPHLIGTHPVPDANQFNGSNGFGMVENHGNI